MLNLVHLPRITVASPKPDVYLGVSFSVFLLVFLVSIVPWLLFCGGGRSKLLPPEDQLELKTNGMESRWLRPVWCWLPYNHTRRETSAWKADGRYLALSMICTSIHSFEPASVSTGHITVSPFLLKTIHQTTTPSDLSHPRALERIKRHNIAFLLFVFQVRMRNVQRALDAGRAIRGLVSERPSPARRRIRRFLQREHYP